MSLADLLKAKQQSLAAGKRGRTIKPANGRGRYRILPSWRKDNGQFWHDFGQHFVKDASGALTAIYMCTDKTFGRPCGVCAVISDAIKSTSDDATMDTLKEARASGSILLNVLHLDGPTPGEVQILEIRPTLFEQIVGIAQEYEAAGISILDITAGKEIIIGREGMGKNTKYSALTSALNTGVVPANVMDKLHDLDAYVQQESADGNLRALNSVRAVAGMLSGPSGIPTAGRLPAAMAGAAMLVDEYATAPKPIPLPIAAPVAAPVAFADVPNFAPAPAPVAAPVAAAPAPVAAPAASASGTGDAELDRMLAELGN